MSVSVCICASSAACAGTETGYLTSDIVKGSVQGQGGVPTGSPLRVGLLWDNWVQGSETHPIVQTAAINGEQYPLSFRFDGLTLPPDEAFIRLWVKLDPNDGSITELTSTPGPNQRLLIEVAYAFFLGVEDHGSPGFSITGTTYLIPDAPDKPFAYAPSHMLVRTRTFDREAFAQAPAILKNGELFDRWDLLEADTWYTMPVQCPPPSADSDHGVMVVPSSSKERFTPVEMVAPQGVFPTNVGEIPDACLDLH